jgi:Arc/MetJ-type ribon-helix-helix transcriptional regulator
MYKNCMVTINISLPEKLKKDAEELIKAGEYVSFSDLVRDSLRNAVEKRELDRLYEKARRELKAGKAIVLRNKEDIDNFMESIR